MTSPPAQPLNVVGGRSVEGRRTFDDIRLRIVSTKLPTIRRSVGVAIPSDRPLMPATSALLEHLRAAASRLDVG